MRSIRLPNLRIAGSAWKNSHQTTHRTLGNALSIASLSKVKALDDHLVFFQDWARSARDPNSSSSEICHQFPHSSFIIRENGIVHRESFSRRAERAEVRV